MLYKREKQNQIKLKTFHLYILHYNELCKKVCKYKEHQKDYKFIQVYVLGKSKVLPGNFGCWFPVNNNYLE